MQGWISLDRNTLNNPIVCKDSDYFSVWIYLLLEATHTNQPKIFKGNKIILKRGQLITGRKKISEKFNISESKIQRILKMFEKEQQIKQQTSNKNRLITILNYNKYQNSEQRAEHPVNNNQTSSEHPVNTNNKDNNSKNVNNVKKNEEKEAPPKTLYLEFVLLTDDEYSNLVKLLDKNIDYYIESLNNYIGRTSKHYDSHYYTIRQWYNRDKADYENNLKGKNLLPRDIESDWLDEYIKSTRK